MFIFSGRLSRKNFGLGVLLASGVPFLVMCVFVFVVLASLNSVRLTVQELQIKSEKKAQQMEQDLQENVAIPEP